TAQLRVDPATDYGYNSWMAGFCPARRGRPPIAFAMVVQGARQSGAAECGPRLQAFFRGFYGEGAE
ncbi:MAG: hypothetical protein ACREID_07800, partial [Planctomycetota bacterium]